MTDLDALEPEHVHAIAHEAAMAGHFGVAEQFYRRALALRPDDKAWQVNLALSLLAQGKLAEGFKHYRARPVRRPSLPFPEWRGEDLKGKRIVLFPEQGFGDQIMFARFAPLLRDQGAEVTLFCAPALATLFGSLGVTVLAARGGTTFPEHDAWAMLVDVPGQLGLALDALPNAPYLHAAPEGRPGGVGIALRGNTAHANAGERFPPEGLEPPFEAVSLHPADTGARDFLETARRIMALDAVVATDTAVAHLAGALGKPTHVLLPAYGADWRWHGPRADSPWYPSMRLHRQRERGDWTELLARVAAALGV